MSEKEPYNHHQWDDVPVPDEGAAWQKMELLLNKKKKRRVVLWWFWPSVICMMAGLLIGGWFWLHSGNNSEKPVTDKKEIGFKNDTDTSGSGTTNDHSQRPGNTHLPISKTDTGGGAITILEDYKKERTTLIQTKPSSIKTDKNSGGEDVKMHHPNKGSFATKKGVKPVHHKEAEMKDEDITEPSILIQSNKAPKQKQNLQTDSAVAKNDTLSIKDTASTLLPASTKASDSASKKLKKKAALVVSVGVGMQQTLTFNNGQDTLFQKTRTASLSDYIPTVYVKLQKGRWSLLADVGYKLPQPVNNLSFSRHTQYDASSFTRSTEEHFIQKLYYHQALLSINYSIAKHLSVGLGGMYNILSDAVTTSEVTTENLVTNQVSLQKNKVPVHGYTDSFFYKTTAGVLVQGSYQLNRFEAGVRYVKNLQPFIKYTTPTGSVLNNSNSSLQAFVRLRLWKSR